MKSAFQFLRRSPAAITTKIDTVLSLCIPGVLPLVKLPTYWFFDLVELIRFGSGHPKKYELLWVRTQDVEKGFKVWRPHHAGVVRNRSWQLGLVDVDDACGGIPGVARRRVEKNESWEECGELERVILERKNNGQSHEPADHDFQKHWDRRYSQLNSVIDEVRETRRLRTMAEFLRSGRFRERGGIGVSLDDDGRIILTEGHHRFGIIKGLGIEKIPVALYAIHPRFMETPDWKAQLERLRSRGD